MPKRMPLGAYELVTLCILTAVVLIIAILGVYTAAGIVYLLAGML